VWIDGLQRGQKQQNCDGASSSCRLVEVKILELKNLSVVFIISESEADLGCFGLGILKFVYKMVGCNLFNPELANFAIRRLYSIRSQM
jgi:hypothetical protein